MRMRSDGRGGIRMRREGRRGKEGMTWRWKGSLKETRGKVKG